ncbi:MAG: dihydropteroate synthase [Spirochaetaceae bacterium]|nr:dihydropteroate synthase [Spirochaetaceae bacterium]
MNQYISLPNARTLDWGQGPLIMGIVNLTPDSFFGGSRTPDSLVAVERALALVAEGADIIDFGAESTRPGAQEVFESEEVHRMMPAIKAFRARSSAVISVDTRHAEVARAALDEGADIINDISALQDPAMVRAAVESDAAVVLMHMQGEPRHMQENPSYMDCASEVRDFLLERAAAVQAAGLSPSRIILDPGFGFGKNLEHNLDIMKRLYLLVECGYPVLVGVSRKRMIGELTGKPVEERLAGSLGAACAACAQGAAIIRVHDVAATRDALVAFRAASRRADDGPEGRPCKES